MDVAVIAMKESKNTTITHFGSMRKCKFANKTNSNDLPNEDGRHSDSASDTALLRVVRGLGDVYSALDRQQGNGYAMVGMSMRAEINQIDEGLTYGLLVRKAETAPTICRSIRKEAGKMSRAADGVRA